MWSSARGSCLPRLRCGQGLDTSQTEGTRTRSVADLLASVITSQPADNKMALSLACIPTTAFAGSMMVRASPHAATHANTLAFVT